MATVNRRVFCVGMNKTGTSTIKECMKILGIEPIAAPLGKPPGLKEAERDLLKYHDYEPALTLAKDYQGFEDRPWNVWEMYKHLDERYPESLFILTIRDPDRWWRSVEHWVRVYKPNLLGIYMDHLRILNWTKEEAVHAYSLHNQTIKNYFEGTRRLLVMDLEADSRWEQLCSFLGTSIPSVEMPHKNKQGYVSEPSPDSIKNEVEDPQSNTASPSESHWVKTAKEEVYWPLKLLKKIDSLRKTEEYLQLESFKCIKFLRGNSDRRLKRLQRKYPTFSPQSLGVVSCYFNPTHSRRRAENAKTFMAQMRKAKVNFLMVELALANQPFLFSGDDVLQLRSDVVLWHKERLLNIGIKRMLDAGCDRIAWLDSDISFDDPNWAWHLAHQLDKANLCQVFSHARITRNELGQHRPAISSLRYLKTRSNRNMLLHQHAKRGGLFRPIGLPGGHPGFGWAAKAEILREALPYDRAIVGSGDRLLFGAIFYRPPYTSEFDSLLKSDKKVWDGSEWRYQSLAYTKHYVEWAQRWSKLINGKVSDTALQLQDMFHGSHRNRFYKERRRILVQNRYNPALDVKEDDNGVLTWASDKPFLHKQIRRYFLSRREDV